MRCDQFYDETLAQVFRSTSSVTPLTSMNRVSKQNAGHKLCLNTNTACAIRQTQVYRKTIVRSAFEVSVKLHVASMWPAVLKICCHSETKAT